MKLGKTIKASVYDWTNSINLFTGGLIRSLSLCVFLILSALLLRTNPPNATIYFAIVVTLILSSVMPLVLSKSILARLLLSSCILLAVYGCMFPYIREIEFWGDEINVINISRLSFGSISKTVSESHIAVPPLDYWILHFWNKVVAIFSVELREFIYRIPYMIMHGFAAFLFAYLIERLVKNSKHKTEGLLIFSLALISYIANPVLFSYSIEVRYYALAVLGSMVSLYLFTNGHIYSLKHYPLLLIFCLNSIFQFIVLTPYIFFGLFFSGNRKKTPFYF